jgi:hypothetical protein
MDFDSGEIKRYEGAENNESDNSEQDNSEESAPENENEDKEFDDVSDEESEDTEQEGDEDIEEDFNVAGEGDNYFGSQDEMEYLIDEYEKLEKAGLTPDQIKEAMPEKVQKYREAREMERKERETRRETENHEEEVDNYIGSEWEAEYLIGERLKLENTGLNQEQINKEMLKQEQKVQDLLYSRP